MDGERPHYAQSQLIEVTPNPKSESDRDSKPILKFKRKNIKMKPWLEILF